MESEHEYEHKYESEYESEGSNSSEAGENIELDAFDIKQIEENIDIQVHASDFDRNSPFNDDIQIDSNKNIESLKMQTQVEIPKVDSNSMHGLYKTSSQPLELVSSQFTGDRAMDTTPAGDFTVIIHAQSSMDTQVLHVIMIFDKIYGFLLEKLDVN